MTKELMALQAKAERIEDDDLGRALASLTSGGIPNGKRAAAQKLKKIYQEFDAETQSLAADAVLTVLTGRNMAELLDMAEVMAGMSRETTRNEMRRLKKGDRFVIGGIVHIAAADTDYCSVAEFSNEMIVYDENDNGWFECDFAEMA